MFSDSKSTSCPNGWHRRSLEFSLRGDAGGERINQGMKTLFSLLLALALPAAAFAAHHEDGEKTAKTDDYPLKTCVVSGEKLGGMGDPYVIMYQEAGKPDREVRLCCEMCKGRFNSNPAKYLAKLDAAHESADHADQEKPQPHAAAEKHDHS